MIQPNSIYIFHKAIDFRCGHDKLAIISGRLSGLDPRSGTLFVFRNRGCNSVKMLIHDGKRMWLLHMRLSQGKFPWWPKTGDQDAIRLADLTEILSGKWVNTNSWQRIGLVEHLKDKDR